MMPTVSHLNHVYPNNQAEVLHQPTRQRERTMRGFKSPAQAQRFLTLHGLTQNYFCLGHHLWKAVNYRFFLSTETFQNSLALLRVCSEEERTGGGECEASLLTYWKEVL
jgi:hypothetical protein